MLAVAAGMVALGSQPAAAAELVGNPSVESGGATPTGWTSRIFGSNTSSFTWLTEGQTGSRSLRINTTARTSGDAKWYFTPVTVTPSTIYTYNVWIRSSIQGQLVAEYKTAAGVVSTQWLTNVAASPGVWAQRTKTFTTPATATSMTIYHLIAGVGTMDIDDASLPDGVAPPPPPPPTSQLVVNPSVESGGTTPTSWTSRIFGSNTTSFTWLTEGRTGSRSLRINTTARTSGDAKWYFAPVTVTPSTTYTYNVWIRSSIQGQLVAEYKTAAGVVSTQWLTNVAASPGVWAQRTKTFTTPATATSMTIYHLIAGIGTMDIDDADLPPVVTTVPLTSTVSSPAAGATVSGSTTLTVTTTGAGVLGVQFFVDGVKVGAEVTAAPYTVTWDTSLWVNGPRSITAKARTAAANVTSAAVAVTLTNAPSPELMPNPGFELSDGSKPTGWQSDSYGVNTATFAHPTSGGRGDSRYVSVTVDPWQSGDAKWLTSVAVPVVGGKSYRYRDWYRSNNQSEALEQVTHANGSQSYIWIGSTGPAADWTVFSGVYAMPATAVSARVWHSLLGAGFLDVDDASFKLEPFTRLVQPLVTVTIDDGRASDITQALPKLQQYGLNGTFYLVSAYLGGAGYITAAQALQLHNAGMEIGSHTVNHFDLATLTPAQQATQLTNSKAALEAIIGAPVPSFASPFGSYNASALSLIKTTYGSHRTTFDGFNTRAATDRYQLLRKTISPSTTPAQVAAWLEEAKTKGTWLILVFHDISPTPGSSGTTPANFDLMMQAIQNSGVTAKTMAGALAEILPQLPA